MKRRDFLKGATLLAAGGALVGPMGGAAELISSPFDIGQVPSGDGIEPLKGLTPIRPLRVPLRQ